MNFENTTAYCSPIKCFTYLFHTRRLATLASQLVREYLVRNGSCRFLILLKLGIERPGIPSQNLSHGFFTLLFVFARIEALQAAAGGAAVQFDAEALTVQFQTASLFASASHNLHLVAVRRFNLCGRRGAQTSDQISRHAILSTRRSTVQRGDLVFVTLLVARWRLLLLLQQ